MIERIEIERLRGIREGRIEGLAPLTILIGPNGCGKSTVLEAFGVACALGSAVDVCAALTSREWLGVSGFVTYCLRDDTKVVATFDRDPRPGAAPAPFALAHTNEINIQDLPADAANAAKTTWPRILLTSHATLTVASTTHRTISVNDSQAYLDGDGRCIVHSRGLVSPLPFSLQAAFVDRPAGASHRLASAHFSSALRDALSTIKLSPWYDQLFSYLQVLRPKLTSIESIAVGDRDEPHAFERDPRVGYPLAYAGDGFRRSLLVAASLARAKGGVAALDEPEAFAHPAMFDALTGLLKRAVSDGTQVVLATHSLEFVAAALRAFEDEPEKAAVVGLRMDSGVLDPITIAGPDAHRRVLELGHDLRL